MLLNPYQDKPAAIPGTRLLESTLGIMGARVVDPHDAQRTWEVHAIYSPLPGRAIGGVRTKLIDQKGFITFCNQRDLEVLLGIGTPGDFCVWTGGRYAHWTDQRWCGLCCDDEDLRDDLQDQEMCLRGESATGVLVPDTSILRRVHIERGYDVVETLILLMDMDPDTGLFPDTRLSTIERRWLRSERARVRWDRM